MTDVWAGCNMDPQYVARVGLHAALLRARWDIRHRIGPIDVGPIVWRVEPPSVEQDWWTVRAVWGPGRVHKGLILRRHIRERRA